MKPHKRTQDYSRDGDNGHGIGTDCKKHIEISNHESQTPGKDDSHKDPGEYDDITGSNNGDRDDDSIDDSDDGNSSVNDSGNGDSIERYTLPASEGVSPSSHRDRRPEQDLRGVELKASVLKIIAGRKKTKRPLAPEQQY